MKTTLPATPQVQPDVVALIDRMTTLIEQFTPPAASRITVADIGRAFLKDKEAEIRNGHYTQLAYDRAFFYLNAFGEMFGAKLLPECRNLDLREFVGAHPEWVSTWTQIDAVGTIVTAFIWAFHNGLIAAIPYRRLKNLPAPRPRPAITEDEYQRLMQTARDYIGRRKGFINNNPSRSAFRIAMCFLWETGCRTSELRAIRWEHVDLEAGIIRLPEHKTVKKSGADRLIPLNRKMVRLLSFLYRHRKPGQEYAIANCWGRQWNKSPLVFLFRKYSRLAGLRKELSAYSLRHGFCSVALEHGVGEKQLADVMGHSTTKYIAWYGRSTRTKVDYLRKTAEAAKGRKSSKAD